MLIICVEIGPYGKKCKYIQSTDRPAQVIWAWKQSRLFRVETTLVGGHPPMCHMASRVYGGRQVLRQEQRVSGPLQVAGAVWFFWKMHPV